MRRTLLGLAAAVLTLTTVPALAADAPALLAPCEDVPAGTPVLTLAKGLQGLGIDTPTLPGDETVRTVVLDLAGQAEGTTASVATTMTWLLPANDYDLTTSGGGDSAKFNVTEPEPNEQAFGAGIGHCERFTVAAVNFAAPVVVDSLELELKATAEELFEE